MLLLPAFETARGKNLGTSFSDAAEKSMRTRRPDNHQATMHRIIATVILAILLHSCEPREQPKIVPPEYDGQPVAPPENAIVLFDGTDFQHWKQLPRKIGGERADDVKWRLIAEGAMQILPDSGHLVTKKKLIRSGHLHIEWASPEKVEGNGQQRGNSGVFLDGFPEIQILDSWENKTYPNGQAAALYKHKPPRVNASKKPGEWQSFDIFVTRSVLNQDQQIIKKASISVEHNGVLVHDAFVTDSTIQSSALKLQDHQNLVQFRNIWYLPN